MAGVEAFVGGWREEEKIGFDSMAAALGLADDKKEFFKQAKTEISYAQDGDHWVIKVGMFGIPDARTFRFKLGEPYQSQSIDGSDMKSIMTADGDRFVEKHVDTGMGNLEMEIERHIEGGKMIVKTKVGPHEMKSIYAKI